MSAAAEVLTRMKLYSENCSPYSASVRITIHAKALDIEIAAPPGGLKSAQYHKINPLGTIPCLILDSGTALLESTAIMEYLEEKFPAPPLLPVSAEARAHVRMLARISDLQIMAQAAELIALVNVSPRDETAAANRLTRIVRGLAALQNYLSGEDFAAGRNLTLADCQLAPALYNVPFAAGAFMDRDLISAYPKVARYIETSRRHPAVDRVLNEMTAACTIS
ncbi:MAG: glutathione S-transferase family protein [Methylovirgula sp.]